MKSKSIIFIILGLLLLGGVGAGIYFLLPTTQVVTGTCTGGTTILSIDKAFITTSSDLGGKEVIRVYATANQGGECARIRFRNYELENALQNEGQDYDVENSVFGDLITNSQSQTFTIFQKQPIYKIAYGEKKSGTLCTNSNCEKDYDGVLVSERETISPLSTCYCFFKEK